MKNRVTIMPANSGKTTTAINLFLELYDQGYNAKEFGFDIFFITHDAQEIRKELNNRLKGNTPIDNKYVVSHNTVNTRLPYDFNIRQKKVYLIIDDYQMMSPNSMKILAKYYEDNKENIYGIFCYMTTCNDLNKFNEAREFNEFFRDIKKLQKQFNIKFNKLGKVEIDADFKWFDKNITNTESAQYTFNPENAFTEEIKKFKELHHNFITNADFEVHKVERIF